MSLVIIVALVALIAALVGIAKRPVATLLTIAVIGGGIQNGIVPVPSALADPVHSAQADVQSWQNDRARAMSCNLYAQDALQSGDEARLDAAEQRCSN